MKIGFIGVGNMGSALVKAVYESGAAEQIYVSDRNTEKTKFCCERYNAVVSNNTEICKYCDYVYLGVKPQMMATLFDEIATVLSERESKPVLVSMAAGIKLEKIEEFCKSDCPIIRIMPNIPVSVGTGVILYCSNYFVTEEKSNMFADQLVKAGMLDLIDEKLFDASSALSGCGPAFVAMFIESLADGAVACGVPRDRALSYAVQTVIGTAEYLKATKMHPSQLKDAVCSPAGSTIEGVKKLEEGAMRATVSNAVGASFERTKELGK